MCVSTVLYVSVFGCLLPHFAGLLSFSLFLSISWQLTARLVNHMSVIIIAESINQGDALSSKQAWQQQLARPSVYTFRSLAFYF